MSKSKNSKFVTRARIKANKYPKQWKAYLRGAICSFLVLLTFVVFYLSVDERSLFNILLGVGVTISGVVFGVFLQELISFLIVPDKDVLFPLRRDALFSEFHSSLEEFSEKINHDDKKLLDDPDTEIWVLLNSPLLIDFDETEEVISDKNYRTKFEKELHHIFSTDRGFKRHLICLSMESSQLHGVSPWERFLKAFSGYVISAIPKFRAFNLDSKAQDEFYSHVDAFRKGMKDKVHSFCGSSYVAPHIHFASQDDLQWQAIVIKAPQIRFYKAVVGFYGEDFFRKYSRLGLMSGMRKDLVSNPDNQGFVSDEPDIVDWVIDGLIKPYFDEGSHNIDAVKHHTSDVQKTICETLPRMEGTSEISTLIDNLSNFSSVKLAYEHGESQLLRKLEYPVYGNRENTDSHREKRELTYCQFLFHPLIAESSTWSSFNLRLPKNSAVLDMCTGIGVQALSAIDRGAKDVHVVDIDPVALLCAAGNLRKFGDRDGLTIKVSLGDGFCIYPFGDFVSKFEDSLKNVFWKNYITQDREKELKDLLSENLDWVEGHYESEIREKSFDLIILEPPFVEFSNSELTPSHNSLYDSHFRLLRRLLRDSVRYLKASDESDDPWLRPYVFQSFSSLENTDELESFVEAESLYSIFRKHCVERNGVHWYTYHFLPIQKNQSAIPAETK